MSKTLIHRILPPSKRAIVVIIIASMIITAIWICFFVEPLSLLSDSGTYITAGRNIISGQIDELRTPFYPILCQLFTLGKYYNGLYLLTGLQLIVFFISVYYFYKTLLLFIEHNIVIFITTCLYAWNIPIIEFTTAIQTESFSISLMVFYAYMHIAILKGMATKRICFGAPMMLFIMIMLRPSSICFIPITLFTLLYAHYRKILTHPKHALMSCLICAIAIIGYCTAYMHNYGSFALSNVTSINRALIYNKNHTLDFPFPSKITYIGLETPDSTINVFCWEYKQAHDCFEKADSIYRSNILRHATSRITAFDISNDHVFPFYVNEICYDYILPIQCVRLTNIYLVLAIVIFLQFVLVYKRSYKNLDITTMLLSACLLVVFTVLWASADSQFGRLMLPMFPCLCMLLGCVAEQFNVKLKIPTSLN